jgi:acetyltransferase-like isoleucine patch superfamily enzyme
MFVTYFPGPLGDFLRNRFWRRRLRYCGKRVRIDVGAYFQNPQYISLDDDSWIDRNVVILAGPPSADRITYRKDNPDFTLDVGEVYIGKCCHIAPNCVLSGIGGLYIGKNSGVASNSTIYTFSHHYRNLVDRSDSWQYSFAPLAPFEQQSMILGPVVIEDYCAIGLNSTIFPGTSVKRGAWVASGTAVKGLVPEQSLVFFDQSIKTKSLSDLKIKE